MDEADQNQNALPEKSEKAEGKMTKKEFVIKEARSVLFMIIYLATSLSLVATFRCLVLIQHGINDFVHSYVVAFVLAVALGKIVVLGQKLPIVNAVNHKPLFISVIYKAAFMAVLANLGARAEEHMFPSMHASTSTTMHPMLLSVTRELALFWIFVVLFIWRDLDRVLGRGTLVRLFFRGREEQSARVK